MRRTLALMGAAIATGTALITGCSDNGATAPMDGHSMESMTSQATSDAPAPGQATASQFNDADVMFARMMYPHHAQAVEMAAMTQGRTSNPDVLELASSISDAQQPEMDRMRAWLSEWGQPAPSKDMDQMDHSGGSGMMSAQDMESLTSLSGGEFDRAWLEMMIEHHTGAIDMADAEIADGSNPDAVEMAHQIVSTQQQEITTMQQLLG